LISPYIFDLISIIAGFYILTKYKIKNSFLFGFTFLILSVRPLYDLFDNYLGYYYNHSDFVLASRIAGHFIMVTYVSISILISIIMLVLLIRKYKGYPKVIIGK
ncbi:MAG: hypothetical protein OQJ81_04495, partial [Melioribacteraceae bacterium]|nr:hypothetical protein [Melioribacteraceae bacterium]